MKEEEEEVQDNNNNNNNKILYKIDGWRSIDRSIIDHWCSNTIKNAEEQSSRTTKKDHKKGTRTSWTTICGLFLVHTIKNALIIYTQ
jgi:hypothetical protein